MRKWLFILFILIAGCQSEDDAERWSVYRMARDGSNRQVLFDDPNLSYWSPTWSPDGRQIAAMISDVGAEVAELYLYDVEQATWHPLTANGRTNYFPVWSPDGDTIVYLSQRGSDTATADIYLIHADGTGEIALIQNDAWEYGMSWSPDGERLVFGSVDGGEWQIYLLDIQTGATAALATPQHGNSPTWSPDGEWIAFTSDRDGDDDIYVTRVDGSELTNLTNNDAWDDNPRWSPDGTQIAFSSDRDGTDGIYILTLATGTTAHLTQGFAMNAGFAAWSPDGSQIMFQAPE